MGAVNESDSNDLTCWDCKLFVRCTAPIESKNPWPTEFWCSHKSHERKLDDFRLCSDFKEAGIIRKILRFVFG